MQAHCQEPTADVARAPRIHALPTELLRVVLSYIHARPRLYQVSLVCKRWRQLVLDTITHLPWSMGSTQMERIVSLCPNIEELPICEYWSEDRLAQLPPTINLRLPPSGVSAESLWRWRGITMLHLRANEIEELHEKGLSLEQFTRLEGLTIFAPTPPGITTCTLSCLHQLWLPTLKRLSLAYSSAVIPRAVTSLFSRIQSLFWPSVEQLGTLFSGHLPVLTSLYLADQTSRLPLPEDFSAALARTCPLLADLFLPHQYLEKYQALAPLFTSLINPLTSFLPWMLRATSLRLLSLDTARNVEHFAPVISHIGSLVLHDFYEPVDLNAPLLRKLEIRFRDGQTHSLESAVASIARWHLPSLRRLSLWERRERTGVPIMYAHAVLSTKAERFPLLRSVMVETEAPIQDPAPSLALIPLMISSGIECFKFGLAPPEVMERTRNLYWVEVRG